MEQPISDSCNTPPLTAFPAGSARVSCTECNKTVPSGADFRNSICEPYRCHYRSASGTLKRRETHVSKLSIERPRSRVAVGSSRSAIKRSLAPLTSPYSASTSSSSLPKVSLIRSLSSFPSRPFLGRQPLAGVCLRGAKADSPLPHDGPLDPLPTLGAGRVATTISCEWRNR